MMVNLTGNRGQRAGAGGDNLAVRPLPDGWMVFRAEPSWDHFTQPGYPKWQAEELGRAKAAGAKGLRILEELAGPSPAGAESQPARS